MTEPRRKRHTLEQTVKKLREADTMLTSGKDLAVVLQAMGVSEATFHRWRNQYGGMKCEEAKRLKQLEEKTVGSKRSWPTNNWTSGVDTHYGWKLVSPDRKRAVAAPYNKR